jgi:hypothetical protein
MAKLFDKNNLLAAMGSNLQRDGTNSFFCQVHIDPCTCPTNLLNKFTKLQIFNQPNKLV